MITVKIGANERRFERVDDVDESWVNQQVNGLRRDGHPVCVRVTIQAGSVYLTVATPACPKVPANPRPWSTEEDKMFEVWERLGLNTENFQGGKIIAFFKQIRGVIT